jgi:hypothetical protein
MMTVGSAEPPSSPQALSNPVSRSDIPSDAAASERFSDGTAISVS